MSSPQTATKQGPDVGHSFRAPELLLRALTHSSFANENEPSPTTRASHTDNEQLEFLGDAVLSLATSEHLCERFPAYSEGELSKLRAHLVSSRHLSKVARILKLGDHLRLGRGEERTGGRNKQAILADAIEAIIAAIYLDGGMEPARSFIRTHIVDPEIDRMGNDPAARTARTDFKSTLQELLQASGQAQPDYEVIAESGPEHNKIFTIQVTIGQEVKLNAQGRSKKLAEQRVAELALDHLRSRSVQAKP
ncbi:MAG: ribonuclease III [Acidobacteriaceae bacterium]